MSAPRRYTGQAGLLYRHLMPNAKNLALKAWGRLPVSVRVSGPASKLRRLLQSRNVISSPPPPVVDVPELRVVRNLEQLDAELKELDRLGAISDDALREGFLQFRMEIEDSMPTDPWSPEYSAKVFELYEFLHGKPYSVSNEVSEFDFETHVQSPFPYNTGSSATVGAHLMGIGHVIRTLDLPAKSRVLELGPGWGNTTLALAQMGHDVTAIDIEVNFVKLITERAARVGAVIDARQGDFAMMKELEPGFDAVLFFESFHHAANHLDVLESLDRIVKPGGRVLFAAEPISDIFLHPWGLRLDGESLWAIRKHGWLELGFRPDYFEKTLAHFGWSSTQVNCTDTGWGAVVVARRTSEG
jgi:phospholipid N-methyltransferase